MWTARLLNCCAAAGANVPTPMTLLYREDIAYRQPMQRPYDMITGPGDGSISLKSLRLCSM